MGVSWCLCIWKYFFGSPEMNSVLVLWMQARIEASLNFVCRENSQRSCGQWSHLQKLMVMGRWIVEQLELVVIELGSTLLYSDRNENHGLNVAEMKKSRWCCESQPTLIVAMKRYCRRRHLLWTEVECCCQGWSSVLVGFDGDYARALCSGKNESVGVNVTDILRIRRR